MKRLTRCITSSFITKFSFFTSCNLGALFTIFFIYYKWCFAFINIYPIYSIIMGGLVDENFNLLKRCCKSKTDAQNELSMTQWLFFSGGGIMLKRCCKWKPDAQNELSTLVFYLCVWGITCSKNLNPLLSLYEFFSANLFLAYIYKLQF